MVNEKPIEALRADDSDGPVEQSTQLSLVGQIGPQGSAVDAVEDPGAFLPHNRHVLAVEIGEIGRIFEHDEIERIGQAAHEILLAESHVGRIEQTGADDEVLRLLVGPQSGGILLPKGGVLLPRLANGGPDALGLGPVAARNEGRAEKNREQR